MSEICPERARGCLLGLAVGDALFGPVEFMTPEQIAAEHGGALTEMVGGGWLSLRPGQHTDDTAMALCLAHSLIDRNGYVSDDVLRRYVRWSQSGPVDIGGTVAGSLTLVASGVSVAEATLRVHERNMGESAGNGTIMRCAPLALAFAGDELERHARTDAALTHYDPVGGDATGSFCALLAGRLHGDLTAVHAPNERVQEALDADVPAAQRRSGRQPGFVLTALAVACAAERVAVYALEHGASSEQAFSKALIWAGNLGGDADTNAAVAGALLGARLGVNAIPARWVAALEARQELADVSDALIS